MRVHFDALAAPPPELTDAFRDALDASVTWTGGALERPGDHRVLVSGRPSDAMLEASPQAELLVVPWAGVGKRVVAVARARGLRVANLHHNAGPTAELAVALLLAVAKDLPRMHAELAAGDWRGRFDLRRALGLAGNAALVIGWGAIGRRIGRALEGLGMKVVPIARRAREGVRGVDALEELLPKADAVLLCAPLTAETRGLLDASRLALLPPRAMLVNVGRGALVDEDALYEALAARRLFGAGLDVWYRYPGADDDRTHFPPATRPFGELPNVVLSPHRGGHVANTEPERFAALAATLNAAASGEPIPHLVDLDAGY
ncbi:MAG: NAD(P)-dependent oxidoreductase [Myxococcota bacterium]